MNDWSLKVNGVKKKVISQGDFVNFVNGSGTAFSWDGYNVKVDSLPGSGGVGTVTSVAAGDGMNFTTITSSGSVTMGTPSTCTAGTSNSLTASSHTHEITGFDNYGYFTIQLPGPQYVTNINSNEVITFDVDSTGATGIGLSVEIDNITNPDAPIITHILTATNTFYDYWTLWVDGGGVDGAERNINSTGKVDFVAGTNVSLSHTTITGADAREELTISTTGVPTITGSPSDNEIVTFTGANTIQGESNLKFTASNVLDITGSLNISNDIVVSSTIFELHSDTSDGTDNKQVSIGGGGDTSYDRGAFVTFYGNEHLSYEGDLYLYSGSTGSIYGFEGSQKRFETNATGLVVQGTLQATSLEGDGSAITGLNYYDHWDVYVSSSAVNPPTGPSGDIGIQTPIYTGNYIDFIEGTNVNLTWDSGYHQLIINTTGLVPDTRNVFAGNGLTGGGALSSDITINLDITSYTSNSEWSTSGFGEILHWSNIIDASIPMNVSNAMASWDLDTDDSSNQSIGDGDEVIFAGSDNINTSHAGVSSPFTVTISATGLVGDDDFSEDSILYGDALGNKATLAVPNGDHFIGQIGVDTIQAITPTQAKTILNIQGSEITNDLGWTSNAGTVTSVALSMPISEFSVTNSPVTTTGTLTVNWDTQTAGKVFASPPGVTGTPQFQVLSNDHMPASYNNSNWDAAYTHSGVISGNPHGISYTDLGTMQLSNLGSYVEAGQLIKGGATDWVTLAKGISGYVLKAGATDFAWGQVAWGEVTGKPTILAFDGSTANGVCTYKDANEMTVESNLTFDGTNLDVAGDVIIGDDIYMGVNQYIRLGTAESFIFHNDSDFYIRSRQHGGRILLQGEDAGGTNKALIYADPDAAVDLYYAGALKFETLTGGAKVIGDLTVSGINNNNQLITTDANGKLISESGLTYGSSVLTVTGTIADSAGNEFYNEGDVDWVTTDNDSAPGWNFSTSHNFHWNPTGVASGTLSISNMVDGDSGVLIIESDTNGTLTLPATSDPSSIAYTSSAVIIATVVRWGSRYLWGTRTTSITPI